MRTYRVTVILSLLCAGLTAGGVYGDARDGYWPTWRGPNADGVAVQGNPPITWSETENIKWKVEMPDSGDGTPIIWGDKIFIQTAVPTAEDKRVAATAEQKSEREIFTPMPTVAFKFNLMCLDRETGKTLWERTAREEIPHEGHHPSSSLASYSPVTDGEHVWVSFGSRGLHCYDVDGNHKWSVGLPELLTFRAFGEGSSPALAGDAIIVVADHEGDSKIFAFNKITGDVLWEKDRDEATSWATPFPVEVDGKWQVITSATNYIRSYDVETGDIVWQCSGLTRVAIPSPVLGFGNVYCTTGFQDPVLLAIELGHTGDLSGTDAIAWQIDTGTPYISSPVLYGDKIYLIDNLKAILSCYKAETGELLYEGERLKGLRQMYSSPTAAAGRLYIAGRRGTTVVLKHSDTFEVLATNTLDDGFDASPVVVGDELFLKGAHYLYCIVEQ